MRIAVSLPTPVPRPTISRPIWLLPLSTFSTLFYELQTPIPILSIFLIPTAGCVASLVGVDKEKEHFGGQNHAFSEPWGYQIYVA